MIRKLVTLGWMNPSSSCEICLDKFYDALDKLEEVLGGRRYVRDCRAAMKWPDRGVYFIFETNESRMLKPDKPRVTRVGRADSSFWKRLHDHQGTVGGGGSQNVSVLRRHVGRALTNAGEGESISSRSPDVVLEEMIEGKEVLKRRVTEYIGAMQLIWLSIDEGPSRATIEENSIRLLSNEMRPVDKPSKYWLGSCSSSERIRKSGLWNSNHVADPCDFGFLDLLEEHVEAYAMRLRSNK
jgi:hypothetical protein